MPEFTNRELANMHFVYGVCNGNARAAEREYRRRFPNRRAPGRQLFTDIHRNLSDHGNFRRSRGQGRPQGDHNLENVLNHFEDDPQISIRTVSRITHVPRSIVMKIER